MATREDSETGHRLDPAPSGGFDIDSFARDHLHCPSCGKYYDDPRTLPCLDSYCRECLEKEARKQREEDEIEREREAREREESGQTEEEDPNQNFSCSLTPSSTEGSTNEYSEPLSNTFDCPQGCQCPTGISFNGDGGAIDPIPPSNKFLDNMVKDVQLKNELPAGKILCKSCNDGEVAVAVCNNYKCANLPLCSDCLIHHLKNSEIKEHRIVDPNPEDRSKGQNHFPTWKNFIRHNWPCDNHLDHPVDRYCYEHKQVICRECAGVSSGHRECAKIELAMDVMDKEIAIMTELIDQVNDIHNKIENAMKEIETTIASLPPKKDKVLHEISDYYGGLIGTLEQQKEEMTAQTCQIYETKMANLKEHQDALKRISYTLQRSIDFIGGSVNMAIPTEFMFLKESFHERLNYLIDRYKDSYMLPSDLNDRLHVKFLDGFRPLGHVVFCLV